MQGPPHIRLATLTDLDAIVQLDRATPLLPHWTVSDYSEAIRGSDAGLQRCLFVAEVSSTLAGSAAGKVTVLPDAMLAELESVAVADSARRCGIGAALCGAVIAWSVERGARKIELEVRSRSEGAIALYRRLGFVAAGRRGRYYRDPEDDAILMNLAITGDGLSDSHCERPGALY